jgi:hypothetical protein
MRNHYGIDPYYWLHDVSVDYLCRMIETEDEAWELAWEELEDRGYYPEDILEWD